MSTSAVTPQPEESITMLSPDYSQAKVVPQSQASDATDAGWSPASKMISPDGDRKWVPNEHGDDLKQKGWTSVEPDGSFHVKPIEGESFSDTMKRAAKAGKGVTPDQISYQTKQGIKDAPLALAAGPAMAGAMMGGAALASPSTVTSTTGAGFLMKEIEEQGPSLLRQGAAKVAELAAKHKITTGAVGLAVLKKLGINPKEVLGELF